MNTEEETGYVVKKVRKGEYQFADRAGFMSMSHCPDCNWRLVPLKKIMRNDVADGHAICNKHPTAAICANPKCWRNTLAAGLETWKIAL